MYFFSTGKNFLSWQKYFVQADGRGIIVDYDIGIKLSKTLCMFSFVPWSYQKYVDCVATDEEDMFFNKYTLSLQYNSFPEEFSPVLAKATYSDFKWKMHPMPIYEIPYPRQ